MIGFGMMKHKILGREQSGPQNGPGGTGKTHEKQSRTLGILGI
jgi:hypothetical protein